MEHTLIRNFVAVLVAWSIGIAASGPAAAKVTAKEITGEILTVNTAARSVVVKTKRGETTFMADSKTQIVTGKDEIRLPDLRPGDKVKIHYVHTGGTNRAERIMVKLTERKR